MTNMSATVQSRKKTGQPHLGAAPSGLVNRWRFLDACHCNPVDRPPIWLMRQAGRALPEYRKLKEKYSFLELVRTPELAAEITLQPVRRFGFDAAILFSDILVVPEAMGQPFRFRDTGGIVMDFAVRNSTDIARLSVERVTERLGYVDKTLRLLRKELGNQTALIGFSGSPWTLATFMMEGGSADRYTRAKALFREDRTAYFALAEKLTAAITACLQMHIDAGVDALQIFDSHGGHLAPTEFPEASARWMKDIVSALRQGRGAGPPNVAQTSKSAVSQVSKPAGHPPAPSGLDVADTTSRLERDRAAKSAVPVIVFSLGTHGNWDDLLATGASVLGIDWQFSLAHARKLLPADVGLQGNLPPALLSDATPEAVAGETTRLLEQMRGRKGYIFNLGHGLPPTAKLENIASMVECIKSFE
jgi:uroporphyrinogen decarboxylase